MIALGSTITIARDVEGLAKGSKVRVVEVVRPRTGPQMIRVQSGTFEAWVKRTDVAVWS